MEDINQNEKQLPTFLKVLCILTFIGAGLSVFSSVFTFYAMQTKNSFSIAMLQALAAKSEDLDLNTLIYNTNVNMISNFITSLVCIIGAFLMWKLNKTGYFIYVFAEICSIIFPFVFPTAPISTLSFIALIFPLGFIAMYSMNLKSLS